MKRFLLLLTVVTALSGCVLDAHRGNYPHGDRGHDRGERDHGGHDGGDRRGRGD